MVAKKMNDNFLFEKLKGEMRIEPEKLTLFIVDEPLKLKRLILSFLSLINLVLVL